MPIYEYRCEACGGFQEAIQKMSDAPLRLCASCGKEALMRVMSKTSFVLKGSGWYATDYKSRPADKDSGTASTAPVSKPESATSASAKSETSPA